MFKHALFALLTASAVTHAQQLSYIESSAGLETPAWDGGKTTLELADINLDGNIDIVTVGDHGSPFINTQMHGVTVWFGDGAGGWSVSQTGNFGYGGVAVGDINNDGLPDVAYGVHHNYSGVDLGDQVLEVALGDGSGTHWTAWDDNLGEQGQSWGMFGTKLADIDADGWLDVASVAFGCCDGIHFYTNNRDGSWTPIFNRLGGNSGSWMDTGDIDADGYPDFVTDHQRGTVWINDGAGGFTSGDAGLPAGGILGRVGATLGDVNSDGRDDLAYCPSNAGVAVWLSTPAGWVRSSAGLPSTGSCNATRFADANADGLVDLFVYDAPTLTLYLGDGAGSWTEDTSITFPSPGTIAALAIGDADRNGHPDIAIVTRRNTGTFSSINELRFYRETSVPSMPTVRLSPDISGDVWRAGSTRFVSWLAGAPAGASTATIELSLSGSAGPWLPLQTLPDSGRAQIHLEPAWSSTDAHLRVTIDTSAGSAEHTSGPITIVGDGCYPDCDQSTGPGVLDVFDFLCFQDAFVVSDPYACDCNQATGAGTCDIFDFLCFQDAFVLGCS
jgi:hypothetical protein